MSQHAANKESKQAGPTEAQGTSAAFGSKETESFANSNELTFTGHPRKCRRGLCDTKAATIVNIFFFSLSKGKSGTVLPEYLLLHGILVFEVLPYSVAQRPFWLCICLLWLSYTNTEFGFFRGFPGKQASALLKQNMRKEACLYNQKTGFGPCWFLEKWFWLFSSGGKGLVKKKIRRGKKNNKRLKPHLCAQSCHWTH